MGKGEAALSVEGIFKKYSAPVLEDINFEVKAGESVALVGANGAGKSTLIKIILSLVIPNSGQVKIFGEVPVKSLAEGKVGYLPELPGYWPELSARELLKFSASLYKLDRENSSDRADKVFRVLGLGLRSHRRMSGYSKGMLQRTGFAQTLLHDPDLLIFDEPMSGLDPRAQEKLSLLIKKLRENGKSFLISSHSLDNVRAHCDRVVVLEQKKLVDQGAVEDVLKRLQERYQNEEPWDEDPFEDSHELF